MAVVAEPEQFKTASGTGERRFATVNPATGEVVQEYPFLPSDQVTAVVEKAHQAFLSWREWPVTERARVVHRAGDLMLERADELAGLLTLEVGKRTAEARGEMWVAGILHYYGEQGPGLLESEAAATRLSSWTPPATGACSTSSTRRPTLGWATPARAAWPPSG